MPEKNEKTTRVRRVSPVDGKIEKLWSKGFVKKMSFEPGVEERRSGKMVTVMMKEMTN